MRLKRLKIFGLSSAILAVVVACNMPSPAPVAPGGQETALAMTLAAMLTEAVNSQPAPLPVASNTPVAAPLLVTDTPSASATATITSTPQDPLVLRDTLCWLGPGPMYDVVSALKKDARVKLLGKGSLAGWWVVDNPIYHDPCWVQASDIQIEPGFDLSTLKTFYPPPTPTYTPTSTATPTRTPGP